VSAIPHLGCVRRQARAHMKMTARINQNKATNVCPPLIENSSNITRSVSFLSFLKYILRRSTSNKECFTINDVTETRISISPRSFPEPTSLAQNPRGQSKNADSLQLPRLHLPRSLNHFCYTHTHIIIVLDIQHLAHRQRNSNLTTRVNLSHKTLHNQPQNPHASNTNAKQRIKQLPKITTNNTKLPPATSNYHKSQKTAKLTNNRTKKLTEA
jgi:hypothetical protein